MLYQIDQPGSGEGPGKDPAVSPSPIPIELLGESPGVDT